MFAGILFIILRYPCCCMTCYLSDTCAGLLTPDFVKSCPFKYVLDDVCRHHGKIADKVIKILNDPRPDII